MANIIVLDDENALRMIIADLLEEAGHTVTQGASGAVIRIPGILNGIDLMITDIIMPDVEGVEVITTLRRTNPEIAIIAMSGGGRTVTEDYLPIAGQLGASAVLHKPFMPEDLLDAVEELLNARRAEAA